MAIEPNTTMKSSIVIQQRKKFLEQPLKLLNSPNAPLCACAKPGNEPYDIFVGDVVSLVALLDVVLVAVHSALPVLASGLVEGEVGAKKSAHDRPPEDRHGVGAHQLADERHRAVLQHADDVLAHQVEVLLAHVGHLVLDFTGVVDDDEGALALLRFYVEFVVFVNGVEFLKEGFVRGAGETTNNEVIWIQFNFKSTYLH